MTVRNEHLAYRPGGVSVFFIYKASFMAAAFWAWLAVLTIRGGPITAWHLLATAGAITATLVGLILGVRHALARNAASRHEQIMHTLVELSWQSFSTPAGGISVPPGSIPLSSAATPDGGDADVIRLPHDSRPRPRR